MVLTMEMKMTYRSEAPKPTEAQLAEIATLEQEAINARIRAEESFRRCDTDGFLSQWALQIGASLDTRKIELLRNGGYDTFPVLCDSDGNVIATKVYEFEDRYVPSWVGRTAKRWRLPDDLADKHGRRWIPVCGLKKSSIQKKLGLHEESRWFPAYAKITTGNRKATGLSGCANAYVAVFKVGE